MSTRNVKINGIAYSNSGDVSITVDYNGTRVFDGTVPTNIVDIVPDITKPPKFTGQTLGMFTTDIGLHGSVPVVVTVHNGILFFNQFWMNYSHALKRFNQVDPDIPIDFNDSSTYTWTTITTAEAESHYGDPNKNTIESDGLTNVILDGKEWNWRTNVSDQNIGNWSYPILSNSVLEFDFWVDPPTIPKS
jgi:hypothetical protein